MKRSLNQDGFTLIEIIVALVIASIALTAAMNATTLLARTEGDLQQRTLALIVAKNRIAERQAKHEWPGIGIHEGDDTQAGIRYRWVETINKTGNPFFRKLDVEVFAEERSLITLTGYLRKRSSS